MARRQFTDTALGLSMTVLNACIDLISFSGILYSIYPPLFVALIVYSVGGTGASLFLGRKLVGLNFQQEAQEANFRCGRLKSHVAGRRITSRSLIQTQSIVGLREPYVG